MPPTYSCPPRVPASPSSSSRSKRSRSVEARRQDARQGSGGAGRVQRRWRSFMTRATCAPTDPDPAQPKSINPLRARVLRSLPPMPCAPPASDRAETVRQVQRPAPGRSPARAAGRFQSASRATVALSTTTSRTAVPPHLPARPGQPEARQHPAQVRPSVAPSAGRSRADLDGRPPPPACSQTTNRPRRRPLNRPRLRLSQRPSALDSRTGAPARPGLACRTLPSSLNSRRCSSSSRCG